MNLKKSYSETQNPTRPIGAIKDVFKLKFENLAYLLRYFVEFLVISTLGYFTLLSWVNGALPAGGAPLRRWPGLPRLPAPTDGCGCPSPSVTTRAARGFGAVSAGLPQMVASPQVVSPEGVFSGTARVVIVGVCTCPPTELIRWAARRVGSRVPVD